MKTRISYLALAVTALFVCASLAPAAPPKKVAKKPKAASKAVQHRRKPVVQKRKVGQPSNAENGLVGIKLFDSGIRLISVYGTPDDIQAVTIGGTSAGPGGGGVGRPGGAGPSGGAGGPMAGPPQGRNGPGSGDWNTPMDDDSLLFAPPPGGVQAAPPMGGAGGGSAGPNGPSGGPMGPAAAGGGGQAGGRVIYTRWIYKRAGSRYGFIMDKFNHVVEIEAVGLSNPKVRTKKGIGFGANFATIIKKYGAPDAYEIGSGSIVMRYLVRNKVAFRLNRLGPDKPHVVTGVVVAAGKS